MPDPLVKRGRGGFLPLYLSDPSLVRSVCPSLRCSSPACAFCLSSDEGALSDSLFAAELPAVYSRQRPLVRNVLGADGALQVVVAATVAAVLEAHVTSKDFANGSDEDRYESIRRGTRIVPSSQLPVPCKEIIHRSGAALIERQVVHQGGGAPAPSLLVHSDKPRWAENSCAADTFIAIFFGAFDARVRKLYRENGNTLMQTFLDHAEDSYAQKKFDLLRLQVIFFARARLMTGTASSQERDNAEWADRRWLLRKIKQPTQPTDGSDEDLPMDPVWGFHHREDVYWNALSRCSSCPAKCPHGSNFVWYCHCSGSPSHHGLLGSEGGAPMGAEPDFWEVRACEVVAIITGAHEAGVPENVFMRLEFLLNALLQPGRYIPVSQQRPVQERSATGFEGVELKVGGRTRIQPAQQSACLHTCGFHLTVRKLPPHCCRGESIKLDWTVSMGICALRVRTPQLRRQHWCVRGNSSNVQHRL